MLLVKVMIKGNGRKESLEINPHFHAQIVLAIPWKRSFKDRVSVFGS